VTIQPGNAFLSSSSAADKARLASHLKLVALDLAAILQDQNERASYVYFPIRGLILLLAMMKDGRAIGSAMVGPSGGVGLASGFGVHWSTSRAVVQAPGFALRISAAQFLKITRTSPTLAEHIFEHQERLLGQMQQTAACNCLHSAGKRLASWLLQAQDHCGGADAIPFTQEFLSNMLGVRRTTVTEVAANLQGLGFIRYSRGKITVVSRARLQAASCECYGVISGLSRSMPNSSSKT